MLVLITTRKQQSDRFYKQRFQLASFVKALKAHLRLKEKLKLKILSTHF